MKNNYPQIAVLGCDSRKANLYYDTERRAWVEHLISSCVNNEQSILEFCQQAYPSLHIGNIVRLDTVLTFENWCELISPIDKNGDNIHRCKQGSGTEENVQPFRCLFMNSQREELALPSTDCSISSIVGTGECLRAEKWQQLASMECANKSMSLSSSIMTLDWCGLSSFRGIEFVCCPANKIDDSDYETSLDEQDNDNNLLEDDPIEESVEQSSLRIIPSSQNPNWMEDFRRWSTDPAYFADDEDMNDYQPAAVPNTEENQRFSKEKEAFRQKYQEQIDQLKSRWLKSQIEIQALTLRNSTAAQEKFESNEIQFRQEYEYLKQSASQERTRMNEVHEIHLDIALNKLKAEANKKLIDAWNEKPLKTETIEKNLYNYLQLLLRDRIHLVNRYERLRAVDPEQAERKRISIHERLRLIVDRINDALNQLRLYSNLQSKIRPRIDTLFFEYDEVNQAAEKLLIDYAATSSTTTTTTTTTAMTTKKARLLPLGRDENKIYPFSMSSTASSYDNNDDYDYATNDEYDEEDDDVDKKSSTTLTTTEIDNANYDQIEVGDSDWDINNDDSDSSFDTNIDDQNQQAFIHQNEIRPLMPMKRIPNNFLITYLPYIAGCLLVLSIIVGLFIFRFIKQNRSYTNKYEKKYVFTEVDSCTPEEKTLHTLQMNGYENPTYKFFEGHSPKC